MPLPHMLKCSAWISTTRELDILQRDCIHFVRLMHGKRAPLTGAQWRFIEVAHGRKRAVTEYGRAWWKYLERLKLERADGTLREPRTAFYNDRDDWKRMSGSAWGDIMRRARGHD